jgi:acyl-coenzyme A synthetase/AMP-(fatty) acid ligase
MDAMAACDGNNPALILFTSGTSGRPKGVVHAYKDLMVETFPASVVGMRGTDICFCCSKMFTSFGLGNSVLFPFQKGAGTILARELPGPGTIEAALRGKPTVFSTVPSLCEMLLPYAGSLKKLFNSVRICIVSGERLSVDCSRQWKKAFGVPLVDCYGSTEMCHSFVSNTLSRSREGSCGKVLRGFAVRFGADGRISCTGPSLFSAYYGDSRLTAQRLEDGWFKTDDIGYRDADGFVFIEGRDNQACKINGKWIFAPDLERKLKKDPAIREAVVITVPGALECFVVTDTDCGAEVQKRWRRRIAAEGGIGIVPIRFHRVAKIARTKNGKIDRGRYRSGIGEKNEAL